MRPLSLLLFWLFLYFVNIPFLEAKIPEPIVQAIIYVESSNQSHVESIDGCRGLGQIQENTWYWICDLMGVHWSFDDAFNPEKNLKVTRFYLNWLENYLKRKGHYSLDLLFACYNAGPGAVRKYGWTVPPYRETITYVRKIKRRLDLQ